MRPAKELCIDHDQLRSDLSYDPETGIFTWMTSMSSRAPAGAIAGCRRGGRYWYIKYRGHQYLAHRLAWFYVHGEWPDEYIDHINGEMTDNRLCNLREADNRRNQQNRGMPSNNKTGRKGVIISRGRYQAQIVVNGVAKYLGRFEDLDEAGLAYERAANRYFADFSYQGSR